MNRKNNKRVRRFSMTALAAGLAMIVASGSAFATTAVSPYREIYQDRGAAMESHAAPVGLSQRTGDVTMTVDSYINTGNGILAAVIFENHGPAPWPAGTNLKTGQLTVLADDNTALPDDVNQGALYDVKALSADGRKLFYLLECGGTGDVTGKNVSVQVTDLILEHDRVHKEVSVDLNSMINRNALLNGEPEIYGPSDEPFKEQYKQLQGAAGVVLDPQYPGVTLQGAAIMRGGDSAGGQNAGLVLYVREDAAGSIPANVSSVHLSVEKLTDKSTGEEHYFSIARTFTDETGNNITAVVYNEVPNVETAARLRLSGISLAVKEKVADGSFKIDFKAEQGFTGKAASVSTTMSAGEAYQADIKLSPVRLTVRGVLADPQFVSRIQGNFGRQLTLYTRSGGVRVLTMSGLLTSDDGTFTLVFAPQDERGLVPVDTADIVAVQLGDKRIELP